MKLQSVKTYNGAKYPNKYEVDINYLLLKNKPNRWHNSSAATVLLFALVTSQLTSCKTDTGLNASRKMNMAPIFEGITTSSSAPLVSNLTFQKQKLNITQLGNFPGPGDFNTLTEESALSIIKAELTSKGISSDTSNKKVDIVIGNTKSKTWSFDLNIKGAKNPVYAEFVPHISNESKDEISERQSINLPDNPKDAAVKLRENLMQVNDTSTGVIFYDNESAMDQVENLKAQVDEFVDWLKTNGLI